MTFSDIARWLWRRRESNPRPRPSASSKPPRPSASLSAEAKSAQLSDSFKAKENPPEQHGTEQRAARHGSQRFGEVDRRRVDREIDGFVVPGDVGDWTSCSDSDESDLSIGWFEPHSSGFSSDTESDNSFAVLVPCYGPSARHAVDSRGKNAKPSILNMIQSKSSSQDSQKNVEKWLASLKNQ